MRFVIVVAAMSLLIRPVSAQMDHDRHHPRVSKADSSFRAMQERGRRAMGVDQPTSVHRFDTLADGGRIELQRPAADSAEVEVIRSHLRDIEALFGEGNFAIPGFVHDQVVPGTEVMAARHALIRYRYAPLPKGGEVRITSTDRDALAAIREFLAFQRKDHRVAPR